MIRGKVHKYGSDVDTDVIIPARYLNTSSEEELAAHCMEDLDAAFVKNVRAGDILVAEDNFGCGSSREHAPIAIKASGIALVIANTFARIFYRNAINIGLPILECPAAVEGIRAGDIVGAIANEAGIPSRSIGAIEIAESFTLVEVETQAADRVIDALRDSTVKGRSAKVRYDRDAAGGRHPHKDKARDRDHEDGREKDGFEHKKKKDKSRFKDGKKNKDKAERRKDARASRFYE